jgi:hypothetical protein
MYEWNVRNGDAINFTDRTVRLVDEEFATAFFEELTDDEHRALLRSRLTQTQKEDVKTDEHEVTS